MMNSITIKLLSIFIVLILCCPNQTLSDSFPDYWPTKGWRKVSPESKGMDSKKLLEILRVLESYPIDSVTIIRDGHIVLDAYLHPYQPDRLHHTFSCTKSITASAVGIAIDKGYLKSVERPLLSFFPNANITIDKEKKQTITLHHALTMTTGIDFRDTHVHQWKNLKQMNRTKDWAKFVLNLPVNHSPGSHYKYSNITSFLLSAVIQEATGMKTSEFVDKYLFSKLGIKNYAWRDHPAGITLGYGSLRMNNLDMAKLGLLYLTNGKWDKEQVISKEWIRVSTSPNVKQDKYDYYYGYQWWVETKNLFFALGKGGQIILVDRKHNLLTVFTSSFPNRHTHKPKSIYSTYILPAIVSDKKIPENPGAFKLLEAHIQKLQKPKNIEKRNIRIPTWLDKYNGSVFTYNQKIFRTNKIKFEIDYEKNELIVTEYDEKNEPTQYKPGITGQFEVNKRKPVISASKATFTKNLIFVDIAMPELGWRAKGRFQFLEDTIEVNIDDFNGNRYFTKGILVQ